jgi:hypothetical protein
MGVNKCRRQYAQHRTFGERRKYLVGRQALPVHFDVREDDHVLHLLIHFEREGFLRESE